MISKINNKIIEMGNSTVLTVPSRILLWLFQNGIHSFISLRHYQLDQMNGEFHFTESASTFIKSSKIRRVSASMVTSFRTGARGRNISRQEMRTQESRARFRHCDSFFSIPRASLLPMELHKSPEMFQRYVYDL